MIVDHSHFRNQMVGIGLVFIPTLPPPFGEALLLGGVSVLSTEFETPKRVMKSARDSFERTVGRHDEESTSLEEDVAAISIDDEDIVEPSQPSQKTMVQRCKTFGRRHVLPLLDQAVGDKDKDIN